MQENPKAVRARLDGKAPLDYIEAALNVPLSHVMKHGADKYGYRNYTVSPCKIRTYVGAVQRHLDAVKLGEDLDPDSGQPHWAHIAACCAVVLGAQSADMLVDDRTAHATELSDRVHIDGDLQAKGEKPASLCLRKTRNVSACNEAEQCRHCDGSQTKGERAVNPMAEGTFRGEDAVLPRAERTEANGYACCLNDITDGAREEITDYCLRESDTYTKGHCRLGGPVKAAV